MKLIVGLGNPGDKYKNTRHNTGFLTMDVLARNLNVSITKSEFQALTAKTIVDGQQVLLMKPMTYMNESGRAIIQAVNYYHIDVEKDLLVIYDDMDLKCGTIRLRKVGNAGGHNGIKSVISHLNTKQFCRIRIGIDKDPQIPTIDYVLGKVKKEDQDAWQQAIERSADAAKEFISKPFDNVMNKYNVKGE